MAKLDQLKNALAALDAARAEHARRVAAARERMDKKGETLNEATSFVGMKGATLDVANKLEEVVYQAEEAVAVSKHCPNCGGCARCEGLVS